MQKKVILASLSPRRKTLLKDLGIVFDIYKSDVDESIREDEAPVAYARRLSLAKARGAVDALYSTGKEDAVVIGADTVVLLDGRIYSKPVNKRDATRILTQLSGRVHSVITAFTIIDTRSLAVLTRDVESTVAIKALSASEIEDYIDTKEPMDKAGAYALQGEAGSKLARLVSGSYTNVVGLPTKEVEKYLKPFL